MNRKSPIHDCASGDQRVAILYQLTHRPAGSTFANSREYGQLSLPLFN